MKGWGLALVLLAVVTPPAQARSGKPPPTVAAASPAQPADESLPLLADDQASAAPADPEIARLGVELETERLRALIARTRFAAKMDEYQANMYRHHQFWTDAAAVTVYFITFFGLLCAAAQFRLLDRLRGMEVRDEDSESAGAVELPGGAKINSPFLGVIILFISLGFFYLYLTNVYPIMSVAEIEAKRAGATAGLDRKPEPPASPGGPVKDPPASP